MKTLTSLAKGTAPLRAIAITADAVAGTRTTVAHGLVDTLGRKVEPEIVDFVPDIADADGAIATPIVFHKVSVDDTNVVFRCNVASATGTLYVG
ncbi:hypothetical protein [Nitrolancea hollandica]|uniref:Uncharacterized protein n=1 Tax=Nitrolancea hollandica Lb TaxID=1129897 RepID=I4EMD7_9BACT|nr:hypothetical protein [Nitrolancea hollandica]CCF85850.1 exported hypothetical protein [Nitrolancea hollandica Lb]